MKKLLFLACVGAFICMQETHAGAGRRRNKELLGTSQAQNQTPAGTSGSLVPLKPADKPILSGATRPTFGATQSNLSRLLSDAKKASEDLLNMVMSDADAAIVTPEELQQAQQGIQAATTQGLTSMLDLINRNLTSITSEQERKKQLLTKSLIEKELLNRDYDVTWEANPLMKPATQPTPSAPAADDDDEITWETNPRAQQYTDAELRRQAFAEKQAYLKSLKDQSKAAFEEEELARQHARRDAGLLMNESEADNVTIRKGGIALQYGPSLQDSVDARSRQAMTSPVYDIDEDYAPTTTSTSAATSAVRPSSAASSSGASAAVSAVPTPTSAAATSAVQTSSAAVSLTDDDSDDALRQRAVQQALSSTGANAVIFNTLDAFGLSSAQLNNVRNASERDRKSVINDLLNRLDLSSEQEFDASDAIYAFIRLDTAEQDKIITAFEETIQIFGDLMIDQRLRGISRRSN
ncbi:hypothetical protein EBQ93_03280 [bacterium]|nr:hypothetical protein [bacterium]